MSHSYKHIPYSGDKKNKTIKRIASKRFRSKITKLGIDDEIFPSMYKRCFESWEICDYYSITTLQKWLINCKNPHGRREGVFDETEEIHIWRKLFIRK